MSYKPLYLLNYYAMSGIKFSIYILVQQSVTVTAYV